MYELLALTKDLIKFKSTASRPEEIKSCAAFIEKFINDLGVRCKCFEKNGVPSILVTPTEGYAPILLMTHFDVVEAAEEMFIPQEVNGCLYGRGAIDDKYAVAISLMLLKKRMETFRMEGKSQEDLNFGLLFTGDEENGGKNGAAHALEHVNADFCIALDGGDMNRAVVKSKGLASLRLTAQGKAAHGARPWLGDNAIENLMEDLLKLRELFRHSSPDHWHKTMNIGLIKGGEVHNKVPDTARAVLDVRYTEKDDFDKTLENMRMAVNGNLEVLQSANHFDAGQSPYLDKLLEMYPEISPVKEHGASDARYLSERGVPGLIWGASGEMSQHTENEHLLIGSMYELFEKLDRYLNAVV